jgi:DNA-binding transcriptional ArsR family regulator
MYYKHMREMADRQILKRLAEGPANDVELARAMGLCVFDTFAARRAVRGHARRLQNEGLVVGRRAGKLFEWRLVG